jgi:excisionase family DNA binding protein
MGQSLLTLEDSAKILNVSYARAAQLAREGVLPGTVRLGRQIRVHPDKLQEFIDTGGCALPGGWRRQTAD